MRIKQQSKNKAAKQIIVNNQRSKRWSNKEYKIKESL